jgi:hypothetical protein
VVGETTGQGKIFIGGEHEVDRAITRNERSELNALHSEYLTLDSVSLRWRMSSVGMSACHAMQAQSTESQAATSVIVAISDLTIGHDSLRPAGLPRVRLVSMPLHRVRSSSQGLCRRYSAPEGPIPIYRRSGDSFQQRNTRAQNQELS